MAAKAIAGALALCLSASLSACVTTSASGTGADPFDLDPPRWAVEAGRATPGVLIIDLPLDEVHARCRSERWPGDHIACVDYNIPTGIWVIFTSTRDRAVMDHEYAHIGGWEHD